LVRNAVYSLLLKKKEFKDEHLKVLEAFYQRSFFYPYLANFGRTGK